MRVSSATSVLERHVQVGADEDALAADIGSRTERGSLIRAASRSLRQIDQPRRVAPLVVVPAEDLHRRSLAIVSPLSKMHEYGECTMSDETIGSSV